MKDYLKRNALWAYLNVAGAARGIRPTQLQRVAEYLDSKFRLQTFTSEFPAQRPRSLFPGLRPISIYDTGKLPWVASIEQNAEEIRDEFYALRESGMLKPHPQKLADAGAWNTYYLYSNGLRFDEHCAACPVTTKSLEYVDGAGTAGQAYFSVMSPSTHVEAHCGPTNTRIRCHLGLIVPDSAVIRIDETKLHWREMECIVFDDSFEHEVWNPDAERAVLIIDAWHPDLTEAEKWALQVLSGASKRNRSYRRGIAA